MVGLQEKKPVWRKLTVEVWFWSIFTQLNLFQTRGTCRFITSLLFLLTLPKACVQWTHAIVYLAWSVPKPIYLGKGPNYYLTKGTGAIQGYIRYTRSKSRLLPTGLSWNGRYLFTARLEFTSKHTVTVIPSTNARLKMARNTESTALTVGLCFSQWCLPFLCWRSSYTCVIVRCSHLTWHGPG